MVELRVKGKTIKPPVDNSNKIFGGTCTDIQPSNQKGKDELNYIKIRNFQSSNNTIKSGKARQPGVAQRFSAEPPGLPYYYLKENLHAQGGAEGEGERIPSRLLAEPNGRAPFHYPRS